MTKSKRQLPESIVKFLEDHSNVQMTYVVEELIDDKAVPVSEPRTQFDDVLADIRRIAAEFSERRRILRIAKVVDSHSEER